MGCTSSRLADEDAVQFCKDRRRYIKQAVEYRIQFAAGHVAYIQSLRRVSSALRSYVEGDEHREFLSGSYAAHSFAPIKKGGPEIVAIPLKSLSSGTPIQSRTGSSRIVNYYMRSSANPYVSVEERPQSPEIVRVESYSPMHQYGVDGFLSMPPPYTASSFFSSSPYNRPSIPPPSPQTSQWDFFWNPFSSLDTYGYPTRSSVDQSSINDEVMRLRRVREEEGIPDLEEEEEEEKVELRKALNNERGKVDLNWGNEAVDVEEDGAETDIDTETEHEASEESQSQTVERVEVSEARNAVGIKVGNKQEVVCEKEEKEETPGFTVFVNRTPTSMVEVVKDLETQFMLICDSAKEVSTLLESSRVQYCLTGNEPTAIKMLNPIALIRSASSRSTSSRFLHVSSSSRDFSYDSGSDVSEESCMFNGSHQSTLDRLYAWEKKLYEEVKSGERIRIAYEKKRMQLRNQDAKGEDPAVVDKTRAAVRDLHTRINVSMHTVKSVSKRIEALRDEELQPQLMELIQGLARMWRVMAECHCSQKRTIDAAKRMLAGMPPKLRNMSGGTDPFRLSRSASNLESELRNWRACFDSWIASQRSYIRALASWALRCARSDIDPQSPRRSDGPPPIFGICIQWSRFLDELRDAPVVDGLDFFAAGVGSVFGRGEEEAKKSKRFGVGFSADTEGKMALVEREEDDERVEKTAELADKTTMEKALHWLILLSLTIPSGSKSTTSITRFQSSVSIAKITNRRILHQPLFPMSFTPPPPDNPFFPQITPPSQPDPDQQDITLSPTPTNSINPVLPTSPKSNPIKKIAIAGSVSIATLFFVLALALLVYRFRERCVLESVKLGGSDSERFPPATSYILHLGTTRPSNRVGGDLNRSPYHRVNRVHGEDVLHPSPDLQPLPPLMCGNRQILPSVLSSDDETLFYSPQESIVRNTESSDYAATQQSLPKTTSTTATRSVISCFNGSTSCILSLETNNSNCSTALPSSLPSPSLSQLPCLQQPHLQFALTKMMSPLTKNLKVSSPASSDRNSVLSCSTNNSPPLEEKSSSMPPPPPPPPPLPALLGKIRPPTINALPMTIQPSSRLQSQVPAPANASRDEALVPVVEANYGGSSLEPLKREEDSDSTKPRLKPLHWDKVRASSDCTMVWDQLKTGSFQLNEAMIQTLFASSTSTNPLQKEANRNSALPHVGKENKVLDVKRSQNMAIILRALNVTLEEVSEALLDGNPEGLGTEILEALVKMAPTKEEELKLKDYNGEISKLGSAERFLKAVLDIPFAFERVDAMQYRANFDADVKYLSNSFEILEAACKELKNSRLFLKLLEAVLRTGNRMNVGTNHGEAKAFRLDSLLKLVDIKGTDGKTTLLHFVVQEIIRSEALDSDIPNQMQYKDKKQGLQVVAALSTELGNVKKAAGMDPSVLSSHLLKLITGLEKIKLTLEEKSSMQQEKFFDSMHLFIKESEDKIVQIKAKEKTAFSHVREISEYFHGDKAKEEAHPFRIFMIVRDFLLVLDQVCKDVHERTIVGSVRTFRIPVRASSLPVFNRFNTRQDRTSSDEDSSSSF